MGGSLSRAEGSKKLGEKATDSPGDGCTFLASIALEMRAMKILIVITSLDQLGNTGKTGFWLEAFAAPITCSRKRAWR
jgi:hypothetical protein